MIEQASVPVSGISESMSIATLPTGCTLREPIDLV
jgi:hypothetical protein